MRTIDDRWPVTISREQWDREMAEETERREARERQLYGRTLSEIMGDVARAAGSRIDGMILDALSRT